MANRIGLAILVVLCALAMVTPASAATVNGVDYVLLARQEILMELSKDCDPLPADTLGCMIITGNIGVSDVNGRLRTGINNLIFGTTTAHNTVLATGAEITKCQFDITSGAPVATVCTTVVTPLPAGTLPIHPWPVNNGPLGPVAISPGCNVNLAANVTVLAGQTMNLNPGCYRDVRVNSGGTLNLSAGIYDFRTLRLIAGSTMNGGGQPATTVTVRDQAITEAGVTITSLRLQTVSTANFSVTESISIGNNSNLSNVVLYAPTSAAHLHTGMQATNFEAVANYLTVEPTVIGGQVEKPCGCFDEVAKQGTDIVLSGGQNLQNASSFVLSANCDPAGGTTVPATAQSATGATLDVSGVAAGTYKVIAIFDSGSYCNNTTVTLP